MAFEWDGQTYCFVVLPFGCAPVCWVFTTVIDVSIAACRDFGLKCLSYIDDGLGGDRPLAEAVRMSGMARALFTAGSSLPGKPESSPALLPYMRHKLRAQLAFWRSFRAPRQVLNWTEFGFMGAFHSECLRIRKQNQESCYEYVEQFECVDSSASQLLDRGVIGTWNPDWGEP